MEHKKRSRKRRVLKLSGEFFVLIALVSIIFAYVTNPFTHFTLVRKPYDTFLQPNGQLALVPVSSLNLQAASLYKNIALVTGGVRIMNNIYAVDRKAKNQDLERIIDEIHSLRFDAKNPYLISGDHFSQLYLRSLGIFYASILDPRTARGEQDWLNRQAIYLKTTAYALDVLSKTKSSPTTIVPLGGNQVTAINIYRPASDSLYSLLYALNAMLSDEEMKSIYPFASDSPAVLQTQTEARALLSKHQDTLAELFLSYKGTVYDQNSGLIRKDILLSGTKDVTKRESALYDNVIFWKTVKLAQNLHIIPQDSAFLDGFKSRILATYWLPDEGHFLEDASSEAKKGKWYSSDWLIVLMAGFLDPKNPGERAYYEKSVSYIQAQKLDQPFGLKYQEDNRVFRQYVLPRLFAPNYGGTAIWSNWGMEYIKLLAILYKETGNREYLNRAEQQLNSYAENIIKYRGYPEVYTPDGEMFSEFFYKSVRQTGWVVSFEQARELVDSLDTGIK